MSTAHHIRLAMRAAARRGVDPYNSHDGYAAAFRKQERDRLRRLSERDANRELRAAIAQGAQS